MGTTTIVSLWPPLGAALGAEGPSFIDSVDHVGVSFPRFYEEMKGIGADIIRLAEK